MTGSSSVNISETISGEKIFRKQTNKANETNVYEL